jgi:hypothetical protein
VAPSGAARPEHDDDQRDEQDGKRRRRYRADPVEARGRDSGRERDRDRYALVGEDLLGDLAPGLALGQGQLPVPTYAMDDETAVKVIGGTVEVVSEGHWKLFNP